MPTGFFMIHCLQKGGMAMEDTLCPKCGANVEGLIKWCDCCGAELHPKNTLFSRMTYCTGAFFDIDDLFQKVDAALQ